MIDQITKTDEIRKYNEREKEKKVLDKLEIKKIEKEKLKEELGSDYSSSEDSFLQELEFNEPKNTDFLENENEEKNQENNSLSVYFEN